MKYKGCRTVLPATMGKRRVVEVCLVLAELLLFAASGALGQNRSDLDAIASALAKNDFSRALELVRPALAAAPTNAQLWAMQGVACVGVGQKTEGLASFQKSLNIAPNYLPALEGAIQIEYEAGSKRAIPLLQRMLRLRPAD